MASITNGRLLTVNEVAEILRLHPQTVRVLIHNGELPACRVGSQLRIRADELDYYIDTVPHGRSAA